MDTKEQLLKEFTEQTKKYMQKQERVSVLLKCCGAIREGGELPVWILTNESLEELVLAIKDEETALDKLRGIIDKLEYNSLKNLKKMH